jgi:microsomal dipeptidase-like Zn-dependent dipeptidase
MNGSMSPWKMALVLGLILLAGNAPFLGAGAGRSKAEEFLVADAHCHEGFAHDAKGLRTDNWPAFSSRGVDISILPLPIARSRTGDLFSLIPAEVTQLKSRAAIEGTFSVVENRPRLVPRTGKEPLQVILSIEINRKIFGDGPDPAEAYEKLGIKIITLWNLDVQKISDGGGLTAWGRRIIDGMNRGHILIDITHLDEKAMAEVIAYSREPVIASHSCARGVADLPSNLSDDVLTLLRSKQGSVFIGFNSDDLFRSGEDPKNGLARLLDHLDYLVKFLGIDHVGLGSDFAKGGKYPADLNGPGSFRLISGMLLAKGFSRADVAKIMSGNLLKALKMNPE